MPSRLHSTTFSCLDPYALASFWAAALGLRVSGDDAPGDPEAGVAWPGGRLLFVQVEELSPTTRVHLDLQPGTTREEEVERLVGLGARVLHDRVRPDGSGWVVLADPEGNELCVERSAAQRGAPPYDGPVRRQEGLHAADERTMLTGMLDWYREGVLAKVAGLAPDLARVSPVRSGTTVAGLVKHLAHVEDTWLSERLAGDRVEPWASAPFDDDPDWEFTSAADEPLGSAVALYRAAVERSRAVVASRGLDDGFDDSHGRRVTLRYVLLHLVEETARHLGHLDVLRELADGATGD